MARTSLLGWRPEAAEGGGRLRHRHLHRTEPDALAHNSFLIWRSGKVGDFEMRAMVRVMGDNNSGIQYRSLELLDVVPWVITGYQCDIHRAPGHHV